MFKIKKIFILASVVFLLFMIFSVDIPFVSSQSTGNYVPLAPLPNTTSGSTTNLAIYAKGIFALLIGVASVLAVIMIVIGGVQYMSTDAISGKSEGKEKITQALYGLLLAMACWLILYTINPNLLNFNILENERNFPTYYGSTPAPTEPGWYLRYQRYCPVGSTGWNVVTGYLRYENEESCRHTVQTGEGFQVEICEGDPPSNAQYQNMSCIQIGG